MKRAFFAILVVLILANVFSACTNDDPSLKTTGGITTEEITSVHWPSYAPKDIYLLPDEEAAAFVSDFFTPKYRLCYYGISGHIEELIDMEKRIEAGKMMQERRYGTGQFIEADEMDTVTYIKYCEISKEDFIAALEKNKQHTLGLVASGFWPEFDFDDERWELPNADIIYTFDNEIINAYYRRENPVVPDWTKVKTYETYADYLAVNPQ